MHGVSILANGTFQVLVAVISPTCSSMEVLKQFFVCCEDMHSLFHELSTFGVSEVSSFTHVKHAGTGMFMNLIEAWMKKHQGSLGLFPLKMWAMQYLIPVQHYTQG